MGGDLMVDIPSEVADAVIHRIDRQGTVASHSVRIAADSSLAGILGVEEVAVNSSHHQACRRLAPGLRAVAWSRDGVVEAVEADDPAWPLWGVQWHPEVRTADDIASHRLFAAFVAAAAQAATEVNDRKASPHERLAI
jgi:putative glutamine amidotransferase